MKKVILLFLFSFGCTLVFAQKKNIVSAYNYLKYEELDKAKSAIDEAAKDPETSAMAKTWYYRGLIYQAMHNNKNQAFAALDSNPLITALNSYNKSIEMDPKSEYTGDITIRMRGLFAELFNKGVEEFNAGKYDKALMSFEGSLKVAPADTMSLINAALAADKGQKSDRARKYYQKLVDMDFKDEKIFSRLVDICKTEKDTAQALTVLEKARTVFPKDYNLMVQQMNLFIDLKQYDKALTVIDQAIRENPSNPELYYSKGVLNDRLNKPEDAVECYKKAISLKADYIDAYYNLGVVYFNKGAELNNRLDKIKDPKEHEKKKKEVENLFNLSLPQLEKAYQLNPKDKNILYSLKQIYARLGNTEKYNKIKAEYNALQ